jgi:hypothetical protein
MATAVRLDEQPTQPSPDVRPPTPALLRWGPLVGFALLLLALARHAGEGIGDPDTLWHVLAGDHLWRTGQFAGPDPLSDFTTGPWILHQWLPDLGLALANHVAGLAGVAWLAQVWRAGVCLAIFVLCRQAAGPLAAALVASAAVLGAADSLSPRPQLVGFILLAVTVGAWLRTAEDRRPRWWLIGVSWVWACCHGTWAVGLTVGVAVILGLAADRRLGRGQVTRLAAIPLLSLAAAALTPVGPRLFESLVTIHAVSPFIQEWRTPTLASASTLITAALAIATPVLWVAGRRRVPFTHVALWAVGVGWAALSMRSIALGAIILAPLAAAALDRALGRPRPSISRGEAWLVGGAAIASLVLAGALAATSPATPAGVPNGLNGALDRLPTDSVVYNSDVLGGWLMWSHPDLRQTADTRWELYGRTRAQDYLTVLNAAPGWDSLFDAYRPSAALVEEHSGLAQALPRRGWTVAERSDGYVLLVPRP